jgi:hypothetical protein
MNLAEYQRRFIALSMAREATEQDFQEFGTPARFLMYRQMIRSRLLGMARLAFKGTRELLGPNAFDRTFECYLAERPPKSPLIRDVVADFGPFVLAAGPVRTAEPDRLSPERVALVSDLVRFEEAKWRVAYAKVPRLVVGEGELRELDFEGVPVLNPALVQLTLAHPVHELASADGQANGIDSGSPGSQARRSEPFQLLVYRPPSSDDIRWYPCGPLLGAVFAGAQDGAALSLVELVRKAATSLGKELDAELLEELATGVTLALQRGVLLGSR